MPENPYAGSIHSRELVRSDDGFPVKLYNFKSALDSAWLDPDSIKASLLGILTRNSEISKLPAMYAIALSWGYGEAGNVRAFDICSYKFSGPWNEDNPGVGMRIFKNGISDVLDEEKICGTGTIILGKEEELRRKTKTMVEFLSLWPDLGDLGPIVEDVQKQH
jgi:hypothetical protein